MTMDGRCKRAILPLFLFYLIISAGCTVTPMRSSQPGVAPYAQTLENTEEGDTASIAEANAVADAEEEHADPNAIIHDGISVEEIEKQIADSVKDLNRSQAEDDGTPLHIPLEINRKVAWWIHYFTVRDRERITRFFERGSKYKVHMTRILKENGLPEQFYYLAMIESGFVTRARSRASAVGIWQFMSATGRNYGLQVNYVQDERQQWVKATEAAASYLKDLHNVFGSWYLAISSYNAGENRVVRSIMRGKTRDFWALVEGKMLPKETMNYVPKFLAAIIIGQNPRKFGINFTPEPTLPEFQTVSVPGGVRLTSLAKATGVPLETIKDWNADLKRNITPYGDAVEIYLPKEHVASIESNRQAIAKLNQSRPSRRYRRSRRSGSYTIYVVRRGDTLSEIAERLGISLRSLKKLNRIRRNRIHPGQRLKYYAQNRRGGSRGRRVSASSGVHVVQRNETLFGIARRHNISIKMLKQLNKMSGSRIYPGQELIVSSDRSPSSQRGKGRRGRIRHKIKRGETLSYLAQRYSTTVGQIKRLNNLRNGRIFAGQTILVK